MTEDTSIRQYGLVTITIEAKPILGISVPQWANTIEIADECYKLVRDRYEHRADEDDSRD